MSLLHSDVSSVVVSSRHCCSFVVLGGRNEGWGRALRWGGGGACGGVGRGLRSAVYLQNAALRDRMAVSLFRILAPVARRVAARLLGRLLLMSLSHTQWAGPPPPRSCFGRVCSGCAQRALVLRSSVCPSLKFNALNARA